MSEDSGKFREHLLRELCDYRKLASILSEEHTALINAREEEIAPIVSRKNELCQCLRTAGTQRISMLASQGLPSSPEGIRIWEAGLHQGEEEIMPLWIELVAVVQSADRQNRINKRLTSALLQHYQSRVNLISSVRCANPTYGSDGMTRNIRTQAEIGRA